MSSSTMTIRNVTFRNEGTPRGASFPQHAPIAPAVSAAPRHCAISGWPKTVAQTQAPAKAWALAASARSKEPQSAGAHGERPQQATAESRALKESGRNTSCNSHAGPSRLDLSPLQGNKHGKQPRHAFPRTQIAGSQVRPGQPNRADTKWVRSASLHFVTKSLRNNSASRLVTEVQREKKKKKTTPRPYHKQATTTSMDSPVSSRPRPSRDHYPFQTEGRSAHSKLRGTTSYPPQDLHGAQP